MRVSIEDLKYRIAEACIVCLQRADEYRLANNYAAYTAKESLVAAEQYRDQLVRQYVAERKPLTEGASCK